ncbi:PREDICTED: uncharacterized protein LOC104810921 [Tarenaya hassleriana]|uniref:uncharacterized protein LOC104810921 n=1 Tax=Tarenaya hassleriana TaxID=28532 RepID=UPI00053C12CF|nr:PREDICTED: uncharacterized protein LOC104810921 [Tarenaya hassleriana]
MDPNGRLPSRFNRLRESSAVSDRLLGTFTAQGPRIDIPSSSAVVADGDLNEDDIFATDLSHTPRSSSSSSAFLAVPPASARPIQRTRSGLKTVEASGILAALPEPSGSNHLGHVFHHKSAAALSTSVSSTASSPSSSGGASAVSLSSAPPRPTAPKPPQERIPFQSSSIGGGKYPQSAPVQVPVMSLSMMNRRRKEFDLADVVDDEEEEEGEMLPPHEIVARSLAQSSLLSCSVLEGAGRTLKGRDLRQVRNAVFRRTGFID